MRQLSRLACLAAAGLFVATAGLEAQKPAGKPAPKAGAASPRIEVSPETKDAGTVAKGQVVDAVFVVKNMGGSDLVISDARPSCGCTVTSFDKVIKPGAEGKIQSSVDTKSFSGPISKSVLIVSNDPERPQRSRVPGSNAPGALTDAGQYSGAVGAPHRCPGTLEEGPAQLLQPGCRPLDACRKLAEPIEPPGPHEPLTFPRRSGISG